MSMSCGARLFELRRGQVHIFPGSDAALKSALRELQRLVEGVDIGIKKLLLLHPVRAASDNPTPVPRAG